jgi:hypothetical protein
MDSQIATSGLAQVWLQGDWITRSVALVLLAMSLATWIIILWKVLDQRAQRAQAKGIEGFWHSADFAEGLDKLGSTEGNPFRAVALEGREATRHILHKDGRTGTQLHDTLDVSDWVERSLRKSVDDFQARAQGGLSVLASVVSELYREAIVRNSPAMIVAHNHPSGDTMPSPEDIDMTRALVAAGELLDIQLIDHLIIGQTGWHSLRELGLGF